MLKQTRLRRIRDLIDGRDQITVSELNEMFDVSEATIRRDLIEMEQLGWVVRSHGGAVRTERVRKQLPLLERAEFMAEQKSRIAARAAALVRPGDTLFLGSGTTVAQLVPHLHKVGDLTVISNSLPVINGLSTHPNMELLAIGGTLRSSELSMVGSVAETAIRMFRADRVFMGMRAIDVHRGFSGDSLDEAMTDRIILTIAPSVVVLADSTKFGRVSTIYLAPIEAADLIVTDVGLDPLAAERLSVAGATLELV